MQLKSLVYPSPSHSHPSSSLLPSGNYYPELLSISPLYAFTFLFHHMCRHLKHSIILHDLYFK